MNIFSGFSSLQLSVKSNPFVMRDIRLNSIYTTGTVSVQRQLDVSYVLISFTKTGEHLFGVNTNNNDISFGYVAIGGGGSGGGTQNQQNAGGGGGGVSYVSYANSVNNKFNNGEIYKFNVGIGAPNGDPDYYNNHNGLRGGHTIINTATPGRILAEGGHGGFGTTTTSTYNTRNISGGSVVLAGTITNAVSSTGTNWGGKASTTSSGGNGVTVATELINDTFAGGGGSSGGTGVSGGSGGSGGGGTGAGNAGATNCVAPSKYGSGGGGGWGPSAQNIGGFQGAIFIWFPIDLLRTISNEPMYIPTLSVSAPTASMITGRNVDLSLNSNYATQFNITATPTSANTFSEITVYAEVLSKGISSSGFTTSYKLRNLTPGTNYDISIVAVNYLGSSSPVVLNNITTKSISLTLSSTVFNGSPQTTPVRSPGVTTQNNFICCPKADPSTVYLALGPGGNSTSIAHIARCSVHKSIDFGASFNVIAYFPAFITLTATTQQYNQYTSMCCSDDGKHVYLFNHSLGLHISNDYGSSWRYIRPGGNIFTTVSTTNYNNMHYVDCDPTGRFVLVSAGSSTANRACIYWANDFLLNDTFSNDVNNTSTLFGPTVSTGNSLGSKINKYTSGVYLTGSDASSNTIVHYKTSTNAFNTNPATSWTDISNGYGVRTNTGRLHAGRTAIERNIFLNNGVSAFFTKTFGTDGITSTSSISQSGNSNANVDGIPCVISKLSLFIIFRRAGQQLRYATVSNANSDSWTLPTGTTPWSSPETIFDGTYNIYDNILYLFALIGTGIISATTMESGNEYVVRRTQATLT